jgi:4-diphosphocytidyl-2-C-methyl-D-erythritol kinase
MSPLKQAICHCPAKVNLFLEVLNKRSDGYHNIQTVFQALRVGDTLRASCHPDTTDITLEGGDTITESIDQNLIIQAAKALQQQYHVAKGIHFTLTKKLPMGAGLGGGSSNCAAALKLCNELWNLELPLQELEKIGTNLGADVPFFIRGGTAFGKGIGEKLTPLPTPPNCFVLIATPHSFVSTKEAYQNLPPENVRSNRAMSCADFVEQYTHLSKNQETQDLYHMLTRCQNDFHKGTLEAFSEIHALSSRILEHNPINVLLSGSGASLFALFREESIGQKCLESISSLCRFSSLTTWELPQQNR